MANTPETPVHLTYGEFAEDTPIDAAAISPPLTNPATSVKSKRKSSKKKKMQAAFASLYDDEEHLIALKSPTWSSGKIQEHAVTEVADVIDVTDVTDITMEESDSLEVKGEDICVDVKIDMLKISEVTETLEDKNIREYGFAVRTEWLGTSQFYLEPLLELQCHGALDQVISYRAAVARDADFCPYDPVSLITLSSAHCQLGFSDVAVGNAHRAILLIEAAMKINSAAQGLHNSSPRGGGPIYPQLDAAATKMIGTKYRGFGPLALEDELQLLHRQAHHALLASLLGTAANWEGLMVAKAIRKLYPDDLELQQLQAELKGAFLDRSHGYKDLKVEAEHREAFIEATRMGKIYQKKYPWLDQNLYKRTPETLKQANEAFLGSCEVKPVVFGDAKPKALKEGEDVGPLGIFATRDIEDGEIVMVDESVTGVSNVLSSKLHHCDACQGCLLPPYMRPEKIIHPSCCDKVAFCSIKCYKLASQGYHKVLCGKDFDWLYETIKKAKSALGSGGHWKTLNFLRVVAVVLADIRGTTIHPLRHPLIARMSANYPPDNKVLGQLDVGHQWLYFTNIVAPTNILLQLGVDIFVDPVWSQEVIQTIFWKIENNANMASSNLTGSEVHLTNINPNYLFLNHSCDPNVSWHGACPNGDVSIDWLRTSEGEILQPGCSAVWVIAARDIRKGEELKISYVGNPKGEEEEGGREAKRAWLEKWFDNGCGCAICEEENRVEKLKAEAKVVEFPAAEELCEMEGVVES